MNSRPQAILRSVYLCTALCLSACQSPPVSLTEAIKGDLQEHRENIENRAAHLWRVKLISPDGTEEKIAELEIQFHSRILPEHLFFDEERSFDTFKKRHLPEKLEIGWYGKDGKYMQSSIDFPRRELFEFFENRGDKKTGVDFVLQWRGEERIFYLSQAGGPPIKIWSKVHNLDVAQRSAAASGLAVAEERAARSPGNAQWQSDLAWIYHRLGRVQHLQGDSDAALKNLRKSLDIRERLAAGDPSNTQWQSDVWLSQRRIGQMHSQDGDAEAALKRFHLALAIARKLAAGQANNAEWQDYLAASLDSVGAEQSAKGDGEAALGSFQSALEIRKRLAASHAADPELQRNLLLSAARSPVPGQAP